MTDFSASFTLSYDELLSDRSPILPRFVVTRVDETGQPFGFALPRTGPRRKGDVFHGFTITTEKVTPCPSPEAVALVELWWRINGERIVEDAIRRAGSVP